MPAVSAIIPDLVPGERLTAANSLNQLSIQASMFSGQAVGGVLYKAFGPALLFCIDGVSYLVAAVCTLFIPRDTRAAPPAVATGTAGTADVHPFRRFLAETVEGFRYVWAQKGQRDFLFAVSLVNFLVMPGTVLFPFYVADYLRVGQEWYGYLTAGISVGVVVGFLGAGALRLTGPERAQGILIAMVLHPVFFGSLALWRDPISALVAVVLGGLTVGFINVYLITLVQASTPARSAGPGPGVSGDADRRPDADRHGSGRCHRRPDGQERSAGDRGLRGPGVAHRGAPGLPAPVPGVSGLVARFWCSDERRPPHSRLLDPLGLPGAGCDPAKTRQPRPVRSIRPLTPAELAALCPLAGRLVPQTNLRRMRRGLTRT